MYGLVDAPILWSIALRHFIIDEMAGQPSRYDENFTYWTGTSEQGRMQLVAVATIHVDDLVVAAKKAWLEAACKRFLAKFGKLKR